MMSLLSQRCLCALRAAVRTRESPGLLTMAPFYLKRALSLAELTHYLMLAMAYHLMEITGSF